MPAKYKLWYLSAARARCEFIRYIFAYANETYDDYTFTRDEWNAGIKSRSEFGTVPILELENGVQISQSLAIGQYLASKFGLVSKDDLENAVGNQIVGAIEDLYRPHFRPFLLATIANDEVKRKEAIIEAEKNGLIPLFNRLEKLLGDKDWFCGKKEHWADFYVAELVDRVQTSFQRPELMNKYPKLLAHSKRVHEIPGIKKYVATRKPTLL